MNKIIIKKGTVDLNVGNDLKVNVEEKTELFDVIKIEITSLKNNEISITSEEENLKLDVVINIKKNTKIKFKQLFQNDKIKIQYKFNLEENSKLIVDKFYDCNNIKELNIVNMNGYNSNLEYKLKTISKEKQKFDLVIYHNNKNTISNVSNKSVNINKGSTTFNTTGIVYNGITGCILSQRNRIINMNNKKNSINPNLLIDEYDTEANHSALIGKFSEEELFYLMSRGIKKETAYNLLIKGFLLEEKDKTVEKIIDKYWR